MSRMSHDSLKDRVLDIVFGARNTDADATKAATAPPPRWVRQTITGLMIVTFVVLVLALLASQGWLPFVGRIDRQWCLAAMCLSLFVRFGDKFVGRHYDRKSRRASGSPQ